MSFRKLRHHCLVALVSLPSGHQFRLTYRSTNFRDTDFEPPQSGMLARLQEKDRDYVERASGAADSCTSGGASTQEVYVVLGAANNCAE